MARTTQVPRESPWCVRPLGYSPELNPDEGITGDLKKAVARKEPARSKAQLKRAAVGHTRKRPKLSHRVRSTFGHKTFRYAAQFKITRAGSIMACSMCDYKSLQPFCMISP